MVDYTHTTVHLGVKKNQLEMLIRSGGLALFLEIK